MTKNDDRAEGVTPVTNTTSESTRIPRQLSKQDIDELYTLTSLMEPYTKG